MELNAGVLVQLGEIVPRASVVAYDCILMVSAISRFTQLDQLSFIAHNLADYVGICPARSVLVNLHVFQPRTWTDRLYAILIGLELVV